MSALTPGSKIYKRRMELEEAGQPPISVEEETRRRERKRGLFGGQRPTILSGIQSALKKRLGA